MVHFLVVVEIPCVFKVVARQDKYMVKFSLVRSERKKDYFIRRT